MFRLLRYFSLTSGIALVAVAIVLAYFYREHAVDDLVDITERKNETLARSFANAIWPSLAPYLASAGALDGDALRARDETRELHETLRRLTADLPVLKVKIYDLEGLTVYSSESAEIGEDKSGNPGFVAAARQGMPASKLIERGTFNAFEGVINERVDLVESYLPIRGGDGRIEGVFELYTDVTPLSAHVQEMTAILLGGIILLFGAVSGVLLLIVWRADRVLKRQYGDLESGKKTLLETNARLEQEVTERRYAEEELRRARDELEIRVDERTAELKEADETLELKQFAIDHSGDPIFWIRRDGSFSDVNDAACRMLGYSRHELLAMSVSDINVDISAASWPKRWETGKTKGFEIFEARHRARNGLIIPVELSINYLAFRGEEYFVVFSRDITERRWAETALRKNEERFRDFAESAADQFWEMDENFRISFLDDVSGGIDRAPARLEHGLTPWELFAVDLEHDKNWQGHKATLEAHEPFRNFEHAYRDQTGELRYRRVSGQPVFDENRAFRGYRGTVTDITERRRAQERRSYARFWVTA